MPTRPARPRGSGRLFVVLMAMSTMACSIIRRPPARPSPYQSGVIRLAKGDFVGADSVFRQSAARCESGREGRRALLFLALLAQDPRNPGAEPDSAALMAARFLYLPDTPPEEALQAEALYVSALDRGADPGLRPDPAAPGLASRFERCGETSAAGPAPPLPVLDSPTSLLLEGLDADRSVLTRRNATLSRRIGELQAELERIRRILQLPDTSQVQGPPGR